MASTMSLMIASASRMVSRLRPGSPCMPTPISISVSLILNVGLPAAGTVQLVKATPILAVCALILSPSTLQVAKSAPASA